MTLENNQMGKQNFPYEITKDAVKWLLAVPKVMLDTLCAWPDRQNKTTAVVNFFYVASFAYLMVAQMAFILDENTEIGFAVDAVTGFLSSGEAMGRRLLCMYLAKRFSKVLANIYNDFWPSIKAGQKYQKGLLQESRILLTALALEALTALLWSLQCCIFPLLHHRLPLSSKFWFKHKESPYYELLYVWEAFVALDLGANIVSFDFFLVSLMWQCVAQFRILRRYLEIKFEEIIQNRKEKLSDTMDLILIVVRRHNDLINTCKEIESMLTVWILILYIGTVGTVCLSSFLLIIAKTQVGKAVPYFVGHFLQVFLYCYVGNELILESTALSNSVAQCGWHLRSYDRNLEKSLILIMVRSQKPVTITVGGFGVLSLSSYMKLIQFCFSVYTVLSSTMSTNESN